MMAGMPGAEGTTRRTLLTGLTGLAAASLTGCSLRLERDAPKLPGLQTASPRVDDATWNSNTALLDALVAGAHASSHPRADELAAMHTAQRTRVVQAAASAGVRVSSAGPDGRTLVDLERAAAAPANLQARLGLDRSLRPAFWAIDATRVAAASLLGSGVTWSGDDLSPAVARAIAPAVYGATYVLEVVAARTRVASRQRIIASFDLLSDVRSRVDLVAGTDAPLDSSDYRLPVRPDDDASRARVVTSSLAQVQTAVAAQALTPTTPPQAAGLLRAWSDVLRAHWPWQSRWEPFPGLRT